MWGHPTAPGGHVSALASSSHLRHARANAPKHPRGTPELLTLAGLSTQEAVPYGNKRKFKDKPKSLLAPLNHGRAHQLDQSVRIEKPYHLEESHRGIVLSEVPPVHRAQLGQAFPVLRGIGGV